MIGPDDLLDHGWKLLTPRTKPSQADIRRAISAFYYSLFHRLSQAGARTFIAGGAALQDQVARAFNHSAMRKVCEAYSRRKPLPPPLDTLVGVPTVDMLEVCDVFVVLQQARHTADYDLTTTVTLSDGLDHWAACLQARDAFGRIERTQEAVVFLAALLLNDRWTRRG